jgi:hypothetical protein
MFIRLRTARADDWSSWLTDVIVTIAAVVIVLIILLARLPAEWIALVGGRGWIVRLLLAGATAWAFMWLDNFLRVLLPRTPYLFGRTLTIRARGQRVRLPVREIVAIHVEQRPPAGHETFVVEMKDGALHDLCPVHWKGAGRLYARVARAQRLAAG